MGRDTWAFHGRERKVEEKTELEEGAGEEEKDKESNSP